METNYRAMVLAVAAKIAVHFAAVTQYGYFRDELYYIASTSHLDFGYVDHPPVSILLLAAYMALFGHSVIAIRLLSVLAGAGVILITVLIARELGGGKYAQGLAALCALVPPAYLGTHHFYSMNSWDHLFWTLAVFLFVRILNRDEQRLWPVLGVVLGIGLMNKISVLWLGTGIAAGLLLTLHRKWLATLGPWLALGIALILFSPYLIWNAVNDFPTLEFIRNATAHKMVRTNPVEFVKDQILETNPVLLPVWLTGLLYSLRNRQWRILGIIYLSVFAVLILSPTTKSSYLLPAYPMLFALGAIALESFFEKRRWLKPVTIAVIILLTIPLVPFAIPILPPDNYVSYSRRLGITSPQSERHDMGELPQHFADMFGWEEMAQKAANAYGTLTPEEKNHCVIFAQNYGVAGAIDVLGPTYRLPRASSGHNSYWLWGPSDPAPLVVIVMNGDVDDESEFFNDVKVGGIVQCRRCMPYERDALITISRKPKVALKQIWPQLKHFE